MGLFTRKSAPIRKAWKELQGTGTAGYNYGGGLVEEGLAGLRSLDETYEKRLKDPLGPEGRGIFARARGQISDDVIRQKRSFGAGMAERARQSGGVLSPAAIAELEQQTQKDLAEGQFRSEFELSSEEASLTLSETNKLFDRREGIKRTIGAVGSEQRAQGLAAWIQAIGGRQSLHFGNIAAATSAVGTAFSAGIGASNASTYAGANSGGGGSSSGNPWGIG